MLVYLASHQRYRIRVYRRNNPNIVIGETSSFHYLFVIVSRDVMLTELLFEIIILRIMCFSEEILNKIEFKYQSQLFNPPALNDIARNYQSETRSFAWANHFLHGRRGLPSRNKNTSCHELLNCKICLLFEVVLRYPNNMNSIKHQNLKIVGIKQFRLILHKFRT